MKWLDIALYLKQVTNIIDVQVWSFAQLRPKAQFTVQTGLIILGNFERESIINTNQIWKVSTDQAYSLYLINDLNTYSILKLLL